MAYENSSDVTVSVVTGKVLFADKLDYSELLEKGSVGILNKTKHRITKTTYFNSNFMAWKTKKIEFNNATIFEVCQSLKNYFDVQIDVNDAAINNCKFTGSFNQPKLEEILKTLEITLNLKITINRNRVNISGKGCQ